MKGRERTGRTYLPGRVPVEVMMCVIGGGPRFEIIRHLVAVGEAASGAIAERLELAIGTTSHHLAILRDHRLVECEHRGSAHVYRLTPIMRSRLNSEGLVLKVLSAQGVITIRSKRMAIDTAA